LASALSHALVNTLIKHGGERVAARGVITGASGMLFAPALFFVDLPTADAWPWLGASLAIHLVYQVCLIGMYRNGDLSLVYPIARGMGPAGVALISWTFLTAPGGIGPVLGLILICGGIFVLAFARRPSAQMSETLPAALAFAVATGVCITAYTLVDAAGVRAASTAMSYIVWLMVLHGVVMSTLAVRTPLSEIVAHLRAQGPLGVTAGLLSGVSYGLALAAFRMGDPAVLAALRETSVVFGAALGILFLKETLGPVRMVAATVIAAGAFVMKAL
jgi:drug/metabolite transporter (DMT)-like permease